MKAASEGQVDLLAAPTSTFEDQDDSIALDIDNFPTAHESALPFEHQDDSIPLDIDDFPTDPTSNLLLEDQDDSIHLDGDDHASAMQTSSPGPSRREDTTVNSYVGVLLMEILVVAFGLFFVKLSRILNRRWLVTFSDLFHTDNLLLNMLFVCYPFLSLSFVFRMIWMTKRGKWISKRKMRISKRKSWTPKGRLWISARTIQTA